MPQAEGKVFTCEAQEKIRADFLETFPYSGADQLIKYETTEFTSVCPFSGLPDFAKIIIEYCPDKQCVELKSLKYYLISFRTIGIYQEDLTNRLFHDLKKIIQPKKLKITTIYNTRGGIDSTCVMGEC